MLDALAKESSAVPSLVIAYQSAIQDVCGYRLRVNKKYFARFMSLQKKLDNSDIEYQSYARTVVGSWWGWCKSKKMRSVPVNLFCGEKAWERYTKDRQYVRIESQTEDESIRQGYDEYQIAILFLHTDMNIRDARWLYSQWIGREHTSSIEIRKTVLSILNLLHGCSAETYVDLKGQLRCKHSPTRDASG